MIPFPADTEALLFDCDGTLVDSMPIHIGAWQVTLADHGVDLPDGFIESHCGRTTHAIVEQINADFGVALDPQQISDEKEARYLERMDEVQPIELVLATARANYGQLAMAVVSGSRRKLVVGALKTIDAIDLFSVLITASDPIPPKPSPEIFLEAARRLDVKPARCHVFEDGNPGITAAREAGMTWTDVRELA